MDELVDFICNLAKVDKKFASTNKFSDDNAVDVDDWVSIPAALIFDYGIDFKFVDDKIRLVLIWTSQNCIGRYAFEIDMYFEREEDAVAFKLTWLN